MHTPGIGATPMAIHILAELAHRPDISIAELSRRSGHGGGRIDRPIAALKASGYIESRQPDRSLKGRPVSLSVTARGMELLGELEGVADTPPPPIQHHNSNPKTTP
jgi:DNA-binding MarR family transcriptional regulator